MEIPPQDSCQATAQLDLTAKPDFEGRLLLEAKARSTDGTALIAQFDVKVDAGNLTLGQKKLTTETLKEK